MPALFGGKPLSDEGKLRLNWLNKIAIALNIFAPAAVYAFLMAEKIQYTPHGYNKQLTLTYVSFSFFGGFILFAEACMLLYAVIKIRLILGQNGLSKRVNVCMFIVNAALFMF